MSGATELLTLMVWVDKNWTKIDFSEYGGIISIWALKEFPEHKIWFGTEDGIYY